MIGSTGQSVYTMSATHGNDTEVSVDLSRVAVIGGVAMGSGIARFPAASGTEVVLMDKRHSAD
jgi:glycerol-3-phosphate dehydrogenase